MYNNNIIYICIYNFIINNIQKITKKKNINITEGKKKKIFNFIFIKYNLNFVLFTKNFVNYIWLKQYTKILFNNWGLKIYIEIYKNVFYNWKKKKFSTQFIFLKSKFILQDFINKNNSLKIVIDLNKKSFFILKKELKKVIIKNIDAIAIQISFQLQLFLTKWIVLFFILNFNYIKILNKINNFLSKYIWIWCKKKYFKIGKFLLFNYFFQIKQSIKNFIVEKSLVFWKILARFKERFKLYLKFFI